MAKKRTEGRRLTNALPRLAATRVLRTRDVVGQGVFAIMLDNLVRVHPQHFPITAQARDINALRRISQHNGQFVLIPRGTSVVRLLENKDLVNTITGAIDDGAMYRITVGGT